MPSAPARAFRRAERAVAAPLERVVESDPGVDVIVRLTALRSRIERDVGRALSAGLHLWQLPSVGDVRRLSQQVAVLERRVRELSREDAEPPAPPGEGDGRPA
jgi:hypothetical protein